MAGFIVLKDGRAYAASNWATDANLRAIARSATDEPLRTWLLAQQSAYVGMGMSRVDLSELAPRLRPLMTTAIRDAYQRLVADGGFEEFAAEYFPGWLQRFGELVEMIDRSEAGEPLENFNPHMRAVLQSGGRRVGPGWDPEPSSDHLA